MKHKNKLFDLEIPLRPCFLYIRVERVFLFLFPFFLTLLVSCFVSTLIALSQKIKYIFVFLCLLIDIISLKNSID